MASTNPTIIEPKSQPAGIDAVWVVRPTASVNEVTTTRPQPYQPPANTKPSSRPVAEVTPP